MFRLSKGGGVGDLESWKLKYSILIGDCDYIWLRVGLRDF